MRSPPQLQSARGQEGGLAPAPFFDQQRTTERARPASLVSLYLLFMSLAVSARARIVASRSMRCREAISLLAIAYAVHALTAPKAHRSMHGTCTYPATGSQVMPRWCSKADSAAFSRTCGEESYTWAINAAAIADATPISDWHPPSAAASVALCLQR